MADRGLTARHARFVAPDPALSFGLLVGDKGTALGTHSLYHRGLGVADEEAMIEAWRRAERAAAAPIRKKS